MRIGVVTTGRSDYGLLVPLIARLHQESGFNLTVYATGMHFSEIHGATINEIRTDPWGDNIVEIPGTPTDDSPQAAAIAISEAIAGFARTYAEKIPDLLVVMGDRMDAMASVIAALPFDLPIGHISGGELSEGVVDDRIRHAITKMAHLHFTAHPDFARRVQQLGELKSRVFVSGEPGLDVLTKLQLDRKEVVYEAYQLRSERLISVCTFHPIGPAPQLNREAIQSILAAADDIDTQIVFTYPNSDPGSTSIIDAIDEYCARRDDCSAWPALGRQRYLSLLTCADCMIGNSSSGLVEAASFGLPVVNIGDRQQGRIAPANVITTEINVQEINKAWRVALSPEFRKSLADLTNPYGDGHAVDRILSAIRTIPSRAELMKKPFADLDVSNC